jgi:hypothetical protein
MSYKNCVYYTSKLDTQNDWSLYTQINLHYIIIIFIIFTHLSCSLLETSKIIIRVAHRLMGGIYKVYPWDGLRCHDIHIKFHKDWFRHSKVDGGIYTDTQTGCRLHMPIFLVLNIKRVFHFSCTTLSETVFVLIISDLHTRYTQKDMHAFIQSVCYFCLILTTTEICQQISVKLPTIRYNENPFSSSWVVTFRQTGRWTWQEVPEN